MKKHTTEQIIRKVRGVEVLAAQGKGCMKALVNITVRELDAMQPPIMQRGQALAPVDLRLREAHARAQYSPLVVLVNADGRQEGAVPHRAAVVHILVARVVHEKLVSPQGPRAPLLELLIQQRGSPLHVHRAHVLAEELPRNLGHAPRGHAVDVHLGHGQPKRPLASARRRRPRDVGELLTMRTACPPQTRVTVNGSAAHICSRGHSMTSAGKLSCAALILAIVGCGLVLHEQSPGWLLLGHVPALLVESTQKWLSPGSGPPRPRWAALGRVVAILWLMYAVWRAFE